MSDSYIRVSDIHLILSVAFFFCRNAQHAAAGVMGQNQLKRYLDNV